MIKQAEKLNGKKKRNNFIHKKRNAILSDLYAAGLVLPAAFI